MNKYSTGDFSRVRQDIKDKVPIPAVWERIYGSIPTKWSSCRCPWRDDTHPSFWVRPDGKRWFDHGTGETGDVFDFYERAAGCDSRQALLDLLPIAGGNDGIGSAPITKAEPVTEEPKKQYHPPLRVPSSGELTAISALRSISVDALRLAVARGFLWTVELKGHQAFVIMDKSRKCYIARKINGERWDDDAKAMLLYGSKGNWPIGCIEAEKYPAIALCEGGPDFLAAFGHAWASGVEDQIAPVCMSSASPSIPDDALPAFTGKRVRIFAHADDAGMKASEQWQGQLTGVASKVDCWRFGSGWIQADGEPVIDLNDLLRIDYECWEDDRTIIEGVMAF
jgi:hypothetical protein